MGDISASSAPPETWADSVVCWIRHHAPLTDPGLDCGLSSSQAGGQIDANLMQTGRIP
jgi:hypothetical protein